MMDSNLIVVILGLGVSLTLAGIGGHIYSNYDQGSYHRDQVKGAPTETTAEQDIRKNGLVNEADKYPSNLEIVTEATLDDAGSPRTGSGLLSGDGPREQTKSRCPCQEPSWCERIKTMGRKEIFMFSLNPKHKQWQHYDWDKVTTVVMVGYLDLDVVCLAHSHGARAISIGNVGTSVLPNVTARAEWIHGQLEMVEANFLDGINFDYEEAILRNQSAIREGYTLLVEETVTAFKKVDPHLMISVDVAWSPDCIDSRCYDYSGLALAADLLFVMAYDERSQILGPCVAWANSAYNNTFYGVHRWLEENIPRDKLILGLPWYGYIYPCTSLSRENNCSISEVPFRGVNCSDAAGKEIDYSETIRKLKNSTSGKMMDPIAQTPYFNYKDPVSNQMYQFWYDDPVSLKQKYNIAISFGLRGVGIWNTEAVDYFSTDPDQRKAVHDMWGALPDWPSN